MKTTEYFEFRRKFPDRREVREEWIAQAIRSPLRKEIQSDGRIRMWAKIAAARGRYLRVVLLEDGETVHNAFFDRDFEE